MARSSRISYKARFVCLTALFFLFGFVGRVNAQTNYQSDYQFQLDQYRKNYAVYQLYRQDYLNHQTLANEQKAILASKDVLVSRELALANFYWLQSANLTSTKVDFPIVLQSISELNQIGQYHFDQSVAVTKIQTTEDLTNFTKESRKNISAYEGKTVRAQVVSKIAKLVQFQLEIKRAYDALLPLLEAKRSNLSVQNGLSQIESYSTQSNDLLLALSDNLTKLDINATRAEQVYEQASETLNQVRSLEQRLIDLIIELDTAHVQR